MNRASVKTLIALDEGIDGTMVEAALPLSGPLQVVGIGEGIDRSWALLEQSSPELLLVATSGHSEPALHLIEGAARQRPDRPIVVFATESPNGFLQRAFAAGADDLIVLPTTAEHVEFTLEKALARTRSTSTEVEQAPLICVLGPKGGTGKTLTACNLAVAFAKEGKRTALVDHGSGTRTPSAEHHTRLCGAPHDRLGLRRGDRFSALLDDRTVYAELWHAGPPAGKVLERRLREQWEETR